MTKILKTKMVLIVPLENELPGAFLLQIQNDNFELSGKTVQVKIYGYDYQRGSIKTTVGLSHGIRIRLGQ